MPSGQNGLCLMHTSSGSMGPMNASMLSAAAKLHITGTVASTVTCTGESNRQIASQQGRTVP